MAADGSPVPEGLQALVAQMLDKDASRRPDAESVAHRLAELGFAAAPAAGRYVASAGGSRDEVIETREAVRPLKRAAS